MARVAWRVPQEPQSDVDGADSLFNSILIMATRDGRAHGDPRLLRSWHWWQDDITSADVRVWLDELVAEGRVRIVYDEIDPYGDERIPNLQIVDRWQYPRFRHRIPIADATRVRVYNRDDWKCCHCGSRDALSIDHIVPVSRGGSDDEDNLQTLCRPCNSRKSNR